MSLHFRRCEWVSWNPWSSCSATCGGGRRTRDRSLCCSVDWDVDQCLAECGLSRSGFDDSSTCNEHCTYGYYSSGRCHCSAGHYGSCCRGTVTCGHPSDPAYGSVSGSSYQYGDVIRYSCLPDYTMTDGDSTRTCTGSGSGYWTGSKPSCVYSKTCRSNPCQHGATCVDGLNRYNCLCTYGWAGTNCELDILPPNVFNCSTNANHLISTPKVTVTWPEPSFQDPMGMDSNIQLTQNYQTNQATFPWGEFFIQYVATKPSNGLRTECLFTESVYPRPCEPLVAPDNGAVACNGWNGRFGEVCTVLCRQNSDLPPWKNISRLYVCGASGQWKPEMDISACSVEYFTDDESDEVKSLHYFNGECDNQRMEIGEKYIEILKESDMHEMCTSSTWAASCVPEKAKVVCGNNSTDQL
ncbi:hypothetical protein NP493_541g01002 [Ridgeia piscesae]|uniref:Uncharacterized protein n=1 Tax=Ridgeia piscesae TaxID=27915 RepID=A0AAD9KVV0_RIDPI|nr:hypothetical protein NP493_541g01002 [Ridgeia piscesae]